MSAFETMTVWPGGPNDPADDDRAPPTMPPSFTSK